MKRICLMGAAVAGLFTAGITSAASAAPAKTTTPTSPTTMVATTLTCKIAVATQIPSNDTTVLAGSTTGRQFGSVGCGKASGVQRDSFTTDNAGNLSGPLQMWFRTGSLYGTYNLTVNPQTGPPTSTSFAQASYGGTMTIKGATGSYRGATGTGTLKCSTQDSAHFDCTAKVKISQTATS